MQKVFNRITVNSLSKRSKQFMTSVVFKNESANGDNEEKEESIRMKQFHRKLKLQSIPRIPPSERFVDLVLVKTNPSNGELISNDEKDPTKWGDWQSGGRVSDF